MTEPIAHVGSEYGAYAAILEISADAIITCDESGRVVQFNAGAEHIFGYRADEVIGRPLDMLLPERFQHAHAHHMASFVSGRVPARRMGERRPIFARHRDGHEFPAEASICKFVVDGRQLLGVTLRDVSARQRDMDDATFLVDAFGDVLRTADFDERLRRIGVWCAKRFADLGVLVVAESDDAYRCLPFGRTADLCAKLEALLPTVVETPSNWPFPLEDVIATGETVSRSALPAGWEKPGAHSEQAARAVAQLDVRAFVVVPVLSRGKVLGALAMARTPAFRALDSVDVTLIETFAERAGVSLENARLLRDARRATAHRDSVLTVVSHDLRGPLAAITMCARVLEQNPPEEEPERRALAGSILTASRQMQRLLQDLLDASLLDSGHLSLYPKRMLVGTVVERVAALIRPAVTEKGIQLRVDVPADLPAVIADEMRLTQALENLAENAVKFTPVGGAITLSASVQPDALMIAVRDTGVGIAAEHLPRIFERYWHADHGDRMRGSGLGLAIAKGIVAGHRGTLTVESVLGKGSIFRILLPLNHHDMLSRA